MNEQISLPFVEISLADYAATLQNTAQVGCFSNQVMRDVLYEF